MTRAIKTLRYEFAAPIATVEDLKLALKSSHTNIVSRQYKNADGTPMRFRVSGQLKTWKRDTTRIYLPMKHGVYDNVSVSSLVEFNANYAVSANVIVE